MSTIYRGYSIEKAGDAHIIRKEGMFVATQLSEDAARDYIDILRRREFGGKMR